MNFHRDPGLRAVREGLSSAEHTDCEISRFEHGLEARATVESHIARENARAAFGVPVAVVLLALLIGALSARADDIDPALIKGSTTQPIANFVRFHEDGHGGGQMQTAFASYVNQDGVTVDLLSTMHIGEPKFFRELARRFPRYDAVLYELVAPRGVPPTEEGVNEQQLRIARDCDLDNQGPHMDYERSNFVHADLLLEEIEKLEVADHGTFKGALGDGPGLAAAKSDQDTAGDRAVYADLQNAKKANTKERYRLMRRAYSQLLEVTARPAPGQTYPAGMEVLVGARNDKVMSVLDEQIAAGKRKLAILYGAAHMVDMEHRLFAKGFKRQSVVWETTWTVAPDGTPTTQPSNRSRG
jgi:hypothetical protein